MLDFVVDPEGNQTDWNYDDLDRVQSETRIVSGTTYTRALTYDQVGNRRVEVDRLGRKIVYDYDDLYRNTHEYWYADESDVTPDHTITFEYDLADYLSSSYDAFHDYDYTRDGLARVDAVTQTIAGLVLSGSTPTPILLDFEYDLTNNVTQLDAIIDGQQDFRNVLEYDALHRLSSVTQSDVTGGNTVSPKHVSLDYNLAGQFHSLYRYAGLQAGGQNAPGVANSQFTYDEAGRIDEINHFRSVGTTMPLHVTGYDLDWDLNSRPLKFEFTHGLFAHESVLSYDYDHHGQVTGADLSATEFDESYTYDQNGNRASSHRHGTGYVTDDFNQLTEDGTYHYSYDAEANRTSKDLLSSWDAGLGVYQDREEYAWDHRNRLTEVTQYVNNQLTETVTYAYDAFNQLIRRTVADGPVTHERFFGFDRVPQGMSQLGSVSNGGGSDFSQLAYGSVQADAAANSADLGQIVLQFDSVSSGLQLTHRYLWGPGVDFQLADEQLPVTNGNGDVRVLWPLVDHLGTVRDLVEYVEFSQGVPETILQKHRMYDSYGNILGEFNRGDLDGDGQFTLADVDALLAGINAGAFGDYAGNDMNGDGVIDQDDIEAYVVNVVGSVMGDANWDGFTDVTDYSIWSANKFTNSDYQWSAADFNGDGFVDYSDFNIWNSNKFTGDGNLNTEVLDHLFGYTGRMLDTATGLQNNLHRWFAAGIGRWISEDPIGFAAGDANLYRYVGNEVTNATDPSGLEIVLDGNDKFKKTAFKQLKKIVKSDPRIKEMLKRLHKSKNTHVISFGWDLRSTPDDVNDARNGTGTGTTITYHPGDPDEVPENVLIHELTHSFQFDLGQGNLNPNPYTQTPVEEEEAVRVENVYRHATCQDLRENYKGNPVEDHSRFLRKL